MTAEELAEIRKRHADDNAKSWAIIETKDGFIDWGSRHGFDANDDRAALLTYTDAQAQRIAELEAQLAARGPTREAIYTAIEEYCYVARDPKDDLSYIVAGKYQAADAILSLPASGALATAQAEQRPVPGHDNPRELAKTIMENCCPAWVEQNPADAYHQTLTLARAILALTASSPAATAQAVTLTGDDLLTPEVVKAAADAGERVGWENVLTNNAQIYHRPHDLNKYEAALRAVLPAIIDRFTQATTAGAKT